MAISFGVCDVEYSTNGSAWTDIRASSAGVSIGGGDRDVGEFYNFANDYADLTSGKRKPLEITVKALYTEGGSDIFEIVRAAYENKTSLYLRWSPEGAASGDFLFTSDAGIVTNAPYPQGEAESADPVTFEFTIKAPKVTKSVVA